MKVQQIRNSMLLFLAAFIWGVAFVAQSVGMDHVGPFTFSCSRSVLAFFFLVLFLILRKLWGTGHGAPEQQVTPILTKREWIGGLWCGTALFAASNLQQIGLMDTSVGIAGFITTFYIILVPVFGIFLKKKVQTKTWICVALALTGLYFLCMKAGSFTIGRGDGLVFCSAVMFAVHILTIDHFGKKADGVSMSCIQFLVCAVLSGICMFAVETPTLENLKAAWLPIVYAGVLSSGVGYTLQIVGQKGMNPTAASLLMSLESVFSVLAGWVLLHQVLTARELMGCGLMFLAVILVQLPERKK